MPVSEAQSERLVTDGRRIPSAGSLRVLQSSNCRFELSQPLAMFRMNHPLKAYAFNGYPLTCAAAEIQLRQLSMIEPSPLKVRCRSTPNVRWSIGVLILIKWFRSFVYSAANRTRGRIRPRCDQLTYRGQHRTQLNAKPVRPEPVCTRVRLVSSMAVFTWLLEFCLHFAANLFFVFHSF